MLEMMMTKKSYLFCLLSLILIGRNAFTQRECKIIIFESIGYCPNYGGGDFGLTEIEFWNDSVDYSIKDSTYSVEIDYGRSIHESKKDGWYLCKDSLDLDFLHKIVKRSKTKFDFITEHFLQFEYNDNESENYPRGSLQIHAYDQDGYLMGIYNALGIANSLPWLNHIKAEANKISSYVKWDFGGLIDLIISIIMDECVNAEIEDND